MELSKFYDAWKAQDNGGYKYEVNVTGSEGRKPGIHASELSCQRRLTYSLMNTDRRPPTGPSIVNMRRRFNVGHALHAMTQHEFKLMCAWLRGSIEFTDEVGIYPELGGVAQQYIMYSSADGIFSFIHEGFTYLRVGVEIKTESEKEYDKMVKPRDEHLEQTCMYMKSLDLPLLWFVYYNKSNSNFTPSSPPYLIQFDRTLWDKKVEPRIVGAHQFAQSGQLPDRTEAFYCRWCPFSWHCQPPSVNQKRNSLGPASVAQQPGALRI